MAAFIGSTSAVAQPDSAKNYPSRPIRLLVPFAAGGGFEVIRSVLQSVASATGKQMVMDNRGGAGGIIAADLAAKATPDGYTAFIAGTATHGTLPNLQIKLPYDPIKDFMPVTLLATTPYVLVTSPATSLRTVKDVIAFAKAKPRELAYGSAGTGSAMHITAELFNRMADVEILHVAFKGGGPAIASLMGGEIQLTFIPPSVVRPHLNSGRLIGVAVTSPTRSKLLPDLPTISEAGVTGFDVVAWYGLLVPTGTPPAAVAWLHREVNTALNTALVKQSFEAAGVEAKGSTPGEFGKYIKSELAKWATILKVSGVRVN